MKWITPIGIYLSSLASALYYAFNRFVIESDSLLEYKTYLVYVKQGHWSALPDNILSSSLWTTYLPSVFQNWLKLDNPETIYRLTLAIVVSFLPLAAYLLVRRYTGLLVSLCLTMILYSAFYYRGFTMYARMQIAVTMVCVLLLSIISKSRWKWVGITASCFGLVASHYTTAFAWLVLLSGGSVIVVLYRAIIKKWCKYSKALISSTLVLSVLVWVGYFIISKANGSYGLRLSINTLCNGFSWTWGTILDGFMAARVLLLARMAIGSVILFWCYKKRAGGVIPALYLVSLAIVTLGLVSPILDAQVGYLRSPYMLMPVELLLVAYWYRDRSLVYLPALLIWVGLYH